MAEILRDLEGIAKLAEASKTSTEPITLSLEQTADTRELEQRLAAVGDQIREATSGAVGFVSEVVRDDETDPALVVHKGERSVVRYQAVPEGPEEAPFLETLTMLAGGSDDVAGARLGGEIDPVDITVFVAPGCPNCPHGVRAANTLAVANTGVSVSVVDAGEFADLASRYQVRSVPTTVIDGGLTIVGTVSLEELVRRIEEVRGPAADAAIFVSLMKSGRIADATARLVDGTGIPAFAELWNDSTLEDRIGLSLAAQNAVDENRAALDPLVELILPSLDAEDGALRGDTADLLGTIGHESARSALEKLLDDDNEDIAEAAEDALESIRERAAEEAG